MYSFKDSLIDWANQKGAWTRILVAAGIALLVTAIILAAAMPGKGAVNTNKVDIGGLKTTMVAVVDSLDTKASQAELENLSQDVTDTLDDQAGDISGLQTRVGNAESGINEAKTNINAIRNGLKELSNSPPEAYLTGVFENYTLHTKSSEAGIFTANVHLVYLAPIYVGNTTTHDETMSAFYGSINFTASTTTPAYVPVATFDGTAWGISEVWFNVGVFPLAANNEKEIDIECVGLNSTWEPSFAYVEVWPILG